MLGDIRCRSFISKEIVKTFDDSDDDTALPSHSFSFLVLLSRVENGKQCKGGVYQGPLLPEASSHGSFALTVVC